MFVKNRKQNRTWIAAAIGAVFLLALLIIAAAVSKRDKIHTVAETPGVTAAHETAAEPSIENKEESSAEAAPAEYILPESDSRVYTLEEIKTLSKEQLRLARNEIYARHGRIFSAEDLQTYFSGKSWYVPIYEADDFDALGDRIFNMFELENRRLIVELESQNLKDNKFYGKTVFIINDYKIVGDSYEITGTVCDTGFSSGEYLKSLKAGDSIPGYGTVVELYNGESVRTERKNEYDSSDEYVLGTDQMVVIWGSGGERVIYRTVEEDVTLIVDSDTEFIMLNGEGTPSSFKDGLTWHAVGKQQDYTGEWILEIREITGTHIDILKDTPWQYAG